MQLPYRKPGKFSQTPNDPLMTYEKLKELEGKLAKLEKSRPFAASEVSRLAELGDFSENVEYQLAKGRLRSINERILRLEYQINHAVVIDPTKSTDRISLGHTATVEVNGKTKTYQILGSTESQPEQGIISHQSPLGLALLGKRVGEVVEVLAGGKLVEYKILSIKGWQNPTYQVHSAIN